MRVKCWCHKRCLLGPRCELHSREGHSCDNENEHSKGQSFSSSSRADRCSVLKRWADLCLVHTWEGNWSLSCTRNGWEWPGIPRSHVWRLLFLRFSSISLSPFGILGKWKLIAFIFILSGFHHPFLRELSGGKKKERKAICWKIKRCTHSLLQMIFDRELFRLKNIRGSPEWLEDKVASLI